MLITYTYRVTSEAEGGFAIECLEDDSIFTCCFTPEEIEPMTVEVTELMLEEAVETKQYPPIPAARQPSPGEFQLTFDLTTGLHVQSTAVKV